MTTQCIVRQAVGMSSNPSASSGASNSKAGGSFEAVMSMSLTKNLNTRDRNLQSSKVEAPSTGSKGKAARKDAATGKSETEGKEMEAAASKQDIGIADTGKGSKAAGDKVGGTYGSKAAGDKVGGTYGSKAAEDMVDDIYGSKVADSRLTAKDRMAQIMADLAGNPDLMNELLSLMGTGWIDGAGNISMEAEGELSDEDIRILAELSGLLDNIRNTVMDSLGLTSQELDGMLKKQGSTIADLINQDTLKQLVLDYSKEADVSAFLTREDLTDKLNRMMQQVSELLDNSNPVIDEDTAANMLSMTKADLQAILNRISITFADGSAQGANQSGIALLEEIPADSPQEQSVNKLYEGKENVSEVSDQESIRTLSAKTGILLSETGTQSDRRQGAEDYNASTPGQLQTLIDSMVAVTKDYQTDFDGSLVQVSELRDIANQIIEQFKVMIKPDHTSMELKLNPEHLGKIDFSVQSKDGILTAQFRVQNELTKEAIEGQMNILREALDQQGIKVEAMEVTVMDYSFGQSTQTDSEGQLGQQHSGSRKRLSGLTLEEAIRMDEKDTDTDSLPGTAEVLGSQIDYIA